MSAPPGLVRPPFKTGYIEDKPDSNDKIFLDTLYKEIATTGVHTQAGFLEVQRIPSYNQQNLGSCVANAVALAIRYGLEIHNKGANKQFAPCRLFIWYWAKFLGGEDDKANDATKEGGAVKALVNGGCQIRDAIKTLYKKGCPPESLWDYPKEDVEFTDKSTEALPLELSIPPQHILDAAEQFSSLKLQYFRIKTVAENTQSVHDDKSPDPVSSEPSRVDQIKHCIAEGYPVVFGISIYQKKIGDKWVDTWNPVDPSNYNEQKVLREPPAKRKGVRNEGHAMLIVGFNRDINRYTDVSIAKKLPGAFVVQNSWGEDLSEIYIPYSYFQSDWVDDVWVIKIEGLLNERHGAGQ